MYGEEDKKKKKKLYFGGQSFGVPETTRPPENSTLWISAIKICPRTFLRVFSDFRHTPCHFSWTEKMFIYVKTYQYDVPSRNTVGQTRFKRSSIVKRSSGTAIKIEEVIFNGCERRKIKTPSNDGLQCIQCLFDNSNVVRGHRGHASPLDTFM